MNEKNTAALLLAALQAIESITRIAKDAGDGILQTKEPAVLEKEWAKARERFESVSKAFYDLTKIS